MILVLGSVHLKSGMLDQTLAISRQHVERSRAEPGCIEHGVHVDAQDPQHLVFVERWSDLKALQTHFAVAESGQFVRDMMGLATDKPEMAVYDASQVNAFGSLGS